MSTCIRQGSRFKRHNYKKNKAVCYHCGYRPKPKRTKEKVA